MLRQYITIYFEIWFSARHIFHFTEYYTHAPSYNNQSWIFTCLKVKLNNCLHNLRHEFLVCLCATEQILWAKGAKNNIHIGSHTLSSSLFILNLNHVCYWRMLHVSTLSYQSSTRNNSVLRGMQGNKLPEGYIQFSCKLREADNK
jgi:hypothetical protein